MTTIPGWIFKQGSGPVIKLDQDLSVGSNVSFGSMTCTSVQIVVVTGAPAPPPTFISQLTVDALTGTFAFLDSCLTNTLTSTNIQASYLTAVVFTGTTAYINNLITPGLTLSNINTVTLTGTNIYAQSQYVSDLFSANKCILNSSQLPKKYYSVRNTVLNAGSTGSVKISFANGSFQARITAMLCDLNPTFGGNVLSSIRLDCGGGNFYNATPNTNVYCSNITVFNTLPIGASTASAWNNVPTSSTPTSISFEPVSSPLVFNSAIAISVELDAMNTTTSRVTTITIDNYTYSFDY